MTREEKKDVALQTGFFTVSLIAAITLAFHFCLYSI